MRPDANTIALRAIRNLLSGAAPLNLQVDRTPVHCTVTRRAAPAWPAGGVAGLDPAVDGPWPAPIDVDCAWEGGRCTLGLSAYAYRGNGRYRHDLGLDVSAGRQGLLWSNVRRAVVSADDGATVPVRAMAASFKRRQGDHDDLGDRVGAALRELVAASGLPMLSASTVQLCAVEVPSGAIADGAARSFERAVHLALLKLDFLDRSPEAVDRLPIVDLGRFQLDRSLLRRVDVEEDEPDEEPARARRYWAGGYKEKANLDEFLSGSRWRIFYRRDTPSPAAQAGWRLFEQIRPGDWFAIKGLGGTHDLKIRLVGEVTGVDLDARTVSLRRLDVPLYEGKGPTGRGSGNWHDTLLEVTRPDILEQIFGVASSEALRGERHPAADVPLNLILYGPPGTGKTFALRKEYMRMFSHEATEPVDTGEDLSWWKAIAVAMRQLGGKATVDQLVAHPLLVAKYAAKPFGVSLRTRIWSSLGQHASDSSSVVKTKRRVGERVFDKTPDGTWFLAEDLPDEVEDRAKATGRGGSQVSQRDYAFVTFHQAYSYEDFVEGIRPVLSGDDDDEASALGYQLRDGVFLKAARAALGLTDFRGSLEEFCELTQPERRRHLDGAPRYALFIDEINRGNVARVLGELITLLEVDKRLGEEHELIVTLPYSQRPFGVPSNLHVIGTMNTADRSVEALDAALRRRFEFRELAPQPDLLRPDVDGVDVQRLLRTINLRLEVLAGRDHAIGHAYFLEALEDDPTIENLKQIFEVKLVPLLQEYFFGDWGKIGLVLGKEFVSRRDHSQVELADFDHPDRETLADRATWELRPMASITNRSFQRIYDPNVAD